MSGFEIHEKERKDIFPLKEVNRSDLACHFQMRLIREIMFYHAASMLSMSMWRYVEPEKTEEEKCKFSCPKSYRQCSLKSHGYIKIVNSNI